MLLKRDAAPAGLVPPLSIVKRAPRFFRGHRAFRATFYKEMVAQTFRIGFRPLAVGKTEDASLASATSARDSSCCAFASTRAPRWQVVIWVPSRLWMKRPCFARIWKR